MSHLLVLVVKIVVPDYNLCERHVNVRRDVYAQRRRNFGVWM